MKLILISGPTAVGKTALGIELAKALGGEIISGDSMQIYKGMDIGTAKPSAAELSAVPHHLIDIADITEAFSVSRFIDLATAAAEDITSRGKLPIVVGGTGMYLKLLVSGSFFDADGANPELRKELYDYAAANGAEALHDRLRQLDSAAADSIHPNNIKRVIRAIEIASGGATKTDRIEQIQGAKSRFETLHLHLYCSDRQYIYDRCDRRVDGMLQDGLEGEVKALYDRGLKDTPTASQAIGYKEFYPYFEGLADLDTTVSLVKQHTRNFVKRQTTYFATFEGKKVVEVTDNNRGAVTQTALNEAKGFING